MATHSMDARGLKCPQPTLRMTSEILKLKKGDILEITADCDTFEDDLKGFVTRMRKTLLWVRAENGFKRAQVRV